MKVLWVYAHPEGRSLNASLRDAGTEALRARDHQVQVSDLYAMGWQPVLDREDFGELDCLPAEISRASKRAYEAGTQAPDIGAEQDKVRWADAAVLQFPLWWYSTPAILKGWIDRVFAKGFAYGLPDPDHPGRTFRYGAGPLSGRRAQVITTAGSPAPAMGPRGVNGQLDQVLFPLLHGTLWYVGMDVLPPLGIYGADRVDEDAHRDALDQVRERMASLGSIAPIAYRHQNGGDYDDDLVLRPDVAPGRGGLAVHVQDTATSGSPTHAERLADERAGADRNVPG